MSGTMGAPNTHEPVSRNEILLVEDDAKLARTLVAGLEEQGFLVMDVSTSAAANEQLQERSFALVILDLGLPDRDGIDCLTEWRAMPSPPPVLVLTARSGVDERVLGLESGADDYLTKPFAFDELLARCRALLRRSERAKPSPNVRVGELHIHLLQRRVYRAGREIVLSPLEFDVLTFLARQAGTTVSRDTLMREVWKIRSRATPMNNVIDVLMTRLREKVDKSFAQTMLITVRGVGYRLKA